MQMLIPVLIALMSSATFALEPAKVLKDDGVEFTKEIEVAKTKLAMSGIAYRKVTFFRVKVWVAALYLEQKSSDSAAILNAKTLRALDLVALHDATADEARQAWTHSLNENCGDKCEAIKADRDRFLAALGPYIVKDRYRYVFSGDGVRCLLNDKEYFSSTNPDFARLLLATWIGPNPPTEDVKKGLLGSN